MSNPTILSIPTILECAKLAESYACVDRAKKNALFGGFISNLLAEKIYLIRRPVQNRYDKNPTDISLRDTSNYLWSLLGVYGLKALNSLEAGGVIVAPASDIGSYLVQLRNYPQIIVGDAGALPLGAGDTELLIADADASPESPNGEVEIHVEGEEEGRYLLDRSSFYPIWNQGQYLIKFNQGVIKGQLIQIKYPVRVNLVYTQTPTPPQSVSYSATLNGVETKSLVDTNGNIFTVAVNAFQIISIFIYAISDTNERFSMNWTGSVYNELGDIIIAPNNNIFPYSNPFGDDFFNNIIVGADDTFQGIRITMTGIENKIINCEAKFSVNTSNI